MLTVRIGKLALRDPFMIASSHRTSTEPALRQLALVSPSAVTLKTTSQIKGGDGELAAAEQPEGRRRKIRTLVDSQFQHLGYWTDGPPTLEFWDIPTTAEMTRTARGLLPGAALGLSVLAKENYDTIAQALDPRYYDYVELNLKYSLRVPTHEIESTINACTDELKSFSKAFDNHPLFVKLPREITSFMDSSACIQLVKAAASVEAAFVVANTLRATIPPSRVDPKYAPEPLVSGVAYGELLFVDTYNLVCRLRSLLEQLGLTIPLVATGGIGDLPGIVDLLEAGVDAVQLCSVIDNRGIEVVELLREQLREICAPGSLHELQQTFKAPHSYGFLTTKARDIDISESNLIKSYLTDKIMLPALEASLRSECQFTDPQQRAENVNELAPFRLAHTRGTPSSWYFALAAGDKLRAERREFTNSAQLLRDLGADPFDLGFLNGTTYEWLTKNASRLGTAMPERIAPIANVMFELVGITGLDVSDVARVYHFGGSSSRAAMTALLKLNPRLEAVSLTPKALFPLLRFWRAENAILMKPPLARYYGLLLRPEARPKWTALWTFPCELLLVGSRAFISTREGAAIAESFLDFLKAERALISASPSAAAARLQIEGFFEYCRSLVSGTI